MISLMGCYRSISCWIKIVSDAVLPLSSGRNKYSLLLSRSNFSGSLLSISSANSYAISSLAVAAEPPACFGWAERSALRNVVDS